MDQIARDQAMNYTGTFIENSSASNISFNFTVTRDQNPLVLSGIQRNGSDIIDT
jgi:hypothetical protein